MKRIVVFTMGTRGDIQPYIYLAQALIKAGYEVTVGTHPCWGNLVTESGVKFIPIGPDIDIEYEAAVIRGTTKNPMLSMLKTMKFVFNIIDSSSKEVYEACKDKELVIVSHSQIGATEAEALKIKTISVTLQTEMIPEIKKRKTLKDKIFAAIINPQMVKPYNKIRKRYNLPKVTSMDKVMSANLNLIPISHYIKKENPNWGCNNKVVGYWYGSEENYEPDERLKKFLEEGSKPIILALGAMSFESKEEKEKLDIFVNAFKHTKMRAIIQGFNKSLVNYQLPESMISVGAIPHSWLFKQGYCVIHHCGFGTSASAMIYGIPSIPIPHILDQFIFAEEIYKLNAGVKPIKSKELNTTRLIGAIEELKSNYEEISKCVTALSEKMIQEKGLETAVELISNVIEEIPLYND